MTESRSPNPPLFIMENMKNRARILTFSKNFEKSNKYKKLKKLVYRYRMRVPVDRIIWKCLICSYELDFYTKISNISSIHLIPYVFITKPLQVWRFAGGIRNFSIKRKLVWVDETLSDDSINRNPHSIPINDVFILFIFVRLFEVFWKSQNPSTIFHIFHYKQWRVRIPVSVV